jgi:hypothetical protein
MNLSRAIGGSESIATEGLFASLFMPWRGVSTGCPSAFGELERDDADNPPCEMWAVTPSDFCRLDRQISNALDIWIVGIGFESLRNHLTTE